MGVPVRLLRGVERRTATAVTDPRLAATPCRVHMRITSSLRRVTITMRRLELIQAQRLITLRVPAVMAAV